MRGIKKNRVLMLIALTIGVIKAQGLVGSSQEIPPGRTVPENLLTSVRVEISIPSIPKVGEVFEATLTIYCKQALEPDKLGRPGPDYKATFEGDVEFINGREHIIYDYMKKGETRLFKAKMVIKEAKKRVGIGGGIVTIKGPHFAQGANIEMFLLDPATGQYGTREEWLKKSVTVLWKYNNIEPQWLLEPDQSWEASNRKIAEEMRKFEPALADSEALCLHEDNYKLIINAIGDANATDSERIEHLLKGGWLKAQRSGTQVKEKWFNDFMEKNKGRWGGDPKLNFFRNNNSTGSIDNLGNSNNSSKERITTTFIGTWDYQDHLYNKDNGLLWSYSVKPVKTAEVAIRAYWTGQGAIWVGWGSTNDSGNFTIQTELIPYGATNVKAYPILFTWGPERYNEMIKVSDPVPAVSTWRNPRDTTIWFLGRAGSPPANPAVPGDTCNFGVCYPDTATPTNTQPRSGSVNILETYLHARTFMSPPPTRPLRVMWEPGYDVVTGMNMTYPQNDDTIWVTANAVNYPDTSTDEWDDDVLLHEFGHYLMKGYAQGPPSDTGGHAWPISYPEVPGIGYGERWAEFFSCRARVGFSTDTLIVNTKKGIGANSVYLWHNIENPWLGEFDTTWFMGGPWCEGAVAGALWDIYDSHDEIPYHSYPWPGFPDTALADTLTMGFAPIWDVFDHYDPAGEPTNCWTIFHFRSGWNAFNYDRSFALNQILLHHRIRDSIPAAPTGLKIFLENNNDVRLYWAKNSEPDLQGYRMYRRHRKFTQPWYDWAMIAEQSTPSDTTYLDTTVIQSFTYQYKLTAFDSLGNESDFSDSVMINLPVTAILLDTKEGFWPNNTTRYIWGFEALRQNLLKFHLGYASGDSVFYASSTDTGLTWVQEFIGYGQYPALSLDKDDNPCLIWIKRDTITNSVSINFAQKSGLDWQVTPIITEANGIILEISPPSLVIDTTDTVHIAYGRLWRPIIDLAVLKLFYATFPLTNPVNIIKETIDSVSVSLPYPMPYDPVSLVLDNTNHPHVSYMNVYDGELYYKTKTDTGWTDRNNMSNTPIKESSYPCIDYYGNRLSLVWQEKIDTTFDILNRRNDGTGWEPALNVSNNLQNSAYPVITAGHFVVWRDSSSGNYEILMGRFVDTLGIWTAPENISQSATGSYNPQATFYQSIDSSYLFTCWVEGDTAPYEMKFQKIVVDPIAKFYVDAGQPVQSPYCLDRDGYWIFGNSPYQTVDWGYNNLRYKFTGLDPQKEYRLDLAYYFENKPLNNKVSENQEDCSGLIYQTKISDENTKMSDKSDRYKLNPKDGRYRQDELNKPDKPNKPDGIGRIIQALVVDGVSLDTSFVRPNKLVRVSVQLPKTVYADGEIVSDILSIKGKRVVCGEIGLFEFPTKQKEILAKGGPQQNQSIPANVVSFNIFPNPAKGNVNIRLQMTDDRGNPSTSLGTGKQKVFLKIYDATGRLVKSFNHLTNKQSLIIWDGKDDFGRRAPSGVYFCKIEINNKDLELKKFVVLKF